MTIVTPLRKHRQALWTTFVTLLFVALFIVYVRWEKQIDSANESRQQSLLLADELRQTSEDLTLLVRSYVVTGNPRYKQLFQDIIAIREFQRMVDERTGEAVQLATRTALLVRVLFVLFAVVVVLMKWRAARALRAMLGGSVEELHERIVRLGRGDFMSDIPVPHGRQRSVMGWLAATQGQLKHQEAERQRLEKELREFAFQDALTGLPNRRLLLDRLQQALHSNTRNRNHLAVLFIDLDHFKQLNDQHGHEAGDRLLAAVAEDLRQQVRQSDTVARLGGDEFVILLEHLGADPEVAAAHANAIAEKVRLVLHADYRLGAVSYRNAASIGVALCSGDDENAATILERADATMYQAKRSQSALNAS